MTSAIPNRWLIAVMGVLLQLCLGTVYAWSYFQKPLVETYHWGNSPVAWVFSLAILFLSLAAAAGGMSGTQRTSTNTSAYRQHGKEHGVALSPSLLIIGCSGWRLLSQCLVEHPI